MDGREVSRFFRPLLLAQARELADVYGCRPGLAAILVGDDPASIQYTRNKRRLAEELGFTCEIKAMPVAGTDTGKLLDTIDDLNRDDAITGILIQLPLPGGVDQTRLFDAIDPIKDIDAVGAASVAGVYRGLNPQFVPCTPRGVIDLLKHYGVTTAGKRAVIIGRSDITGKPLAMLLAGKHCNATVTWCHRQTRELKAICQEADILISCAGVTGEAGSSLVTADMIKPGACVVDVGFRRLPSGAFSGDVDFDAVKQVAGWITPNPGGTGPMTVVALMQNLIDATRYRLGLARAEYPR